MALITVTAAAAAAGAAEIRLRDESRPAGPVVTLGDVAEVAATDPQQTVELAAVELFPSPPPGEQRFVRFRQIQDLLLRRGINLVEHRFSGSSQVKIFAAADEQNATAGHPMPAAAARTAGHGVSQAAAHGLRGDVSLDEPMRGEMVVAARTLPRGTVIGARDVRLDRAGAGHPPNRGFATIEEVLGQETTRVIPAGRALTATSIRPPILVGRGEVVSVYARSPGIRVRSVARARDEGSLGDLLTVESFEDRKTFLARVSGVQEVEVYARAIRSAQTRKRIVPFSLHENGDSPQMIRSGPAATDFTSSGSERGEQSAKEW